LDEFYLFRFNRDKSSVINSQANVRKSGSMPESVYIRARRFALFLTSPFHLNLFFSHSPLWQIFSPKSRWPSFSEKRIPPVKAR
jgi:hypothetical protein